MPASDTTMFVEEDGGTRLTACAVYYQWLAIGGTCAVFGFVGASAYYFSLAAAS